MEYRKFGNAGFSVSAVGFGGGHIGGDNLSDAEAVRLLQQAFGLGITLFDSARGYGRSEYRMGMAFAGLRHQIILSTKIGYGISGFSDWSPEIIYEGVHQALRLLRTDYIDIVHFHSCSAEVLRHNNIIEPLLRCREQGKIRCAAYSGDGDALAYAISTRVFDSYQASVNVCDQQAVPRVADFLAHGNGCIAKRPLANVAWRFPERPVGEYAEEYWLRWQQMQLSSVDAANGAPLRFTLSVPGVSSAIIGTADTAHLQEWCRVAEQGPLEPDAYNNIRSRFLAHGAEWQGQV